MSAAEDGANGAAMTYEEYVADLQPKWVKSEVEGPGGVPLNRRALRFGDIEVATTEGPSGVIATITMPAVQAHRIPTSATHPAALRATTHALQELQSMLVGLAVQAQILAEHTNATANHLETQRKKGTK